MPNLVHKQTQSKTAGQSYNKPAKERKQESFQVEHESA